MKSTLIHKLESLAERFEEVGTLMSQPEVLADQNQFRNLSKEYAKLEPVVKSLRDRGKLIRGKAQ